MRPDHRGHHPARVGGKAAQGLRHAGKQGINHGSGLPAVQRVELMRQRKHQVGVRDIQHLGHTRLQPGLFGACPAGGAVAVTAGVVLPVAVIAMVAGQTLPTQCGGATGTDGTPCFGLGCAQCVGAQVGPAVLLQHSGKGGLHRCPAQKGAWAWIGVCGGSAASKSSGSMPGVGLNCGLMRCR